MIKPLMLSITALPCTSEPERLITGSHLTLTLLPTDQPSSGDILSKYSYEFSLFIYHVHPHWN